MFQVIENQTQTGLVAFLQNTEESVNTGLQRFQGTGSVKISIAPMFQRLHILY